MYQREVAKYRIDDLVREAHAYRLTRETRMARAAERRARNRRVASAVASALTWPIKH